MYINKSEFEYFSLFSLNKHYIGFFEDAIIYSCRRSTSVNMFSDKLGRLGAPPPLRKLENNPGFKHI